MLAPVGSKDKQGNDLHFGTNCLGPLLLYRHLRTLLERTAASSPVGATRILWAGSVGIDIASPSPGGLLWDEGTDQPKIVEPMTDYAQTKTGNLFISKELAKKDSAAGIVHACFNPGNLRTDLQRHWTGFGAWMTVSADFPSSQSIGVLADCLILKYRTRYCCTRPSMEPIPNCGPH